jgi:hypothetical protein
MAAAGGAGGVPNGLHAIILEDTEPIRTVMSVAEERQCAAVSITFVPTRTAEHNTCSALTNSTEAPLMLEPGDAGMPSTIA